MSLRQRLHIILLSGALALCPTWAQADALADVIEAAQSALQQGDAERAYTLLAEQEANYAGNVDYDYWFGLSAVRAGKPARATFALERVLSEQPNHAGARLELATACSWASVMLPQRSSTSLRPCHRRRRRRSVLMRSIRSSIARRAARNSVATAPLSASSTAMTITSAPGRRAWSSSPASPSRRSSPPLLH